MTDIRWAVAAQRDYRNIIERLEDENPAAAQRISDEFSHRLAQLEMMPEIGRPGRVTGTRELVVVRTPYLVVYHLEQENNLIMIDRVLHGAQRWPSR